MIFQASLALRAEVRTLRKGKKKMEIESLFNYGDLPQFNLLNTIKRKVSTETGWIV